MPWVVLLAGLWGAGCGDSAGQGNDDGGTQSDGDVGTDGTFPSTVLDPGFGEHGVLRAPSAWSLDRVYASDLTAEGDLLVGGTSTGLGHRAQPLIARFTGEGALDSSFGNAGFVLLPILDLAEVTDLAALPGGGAVIAGTSFFNDNVSFAARLDDQGALDPSFGDGGIFTWDDSSQHVAVAVDPSGAVVLLHEGSGGIEVRRLTSAGALDASFGSGGIASAPGRDPRDLVVLADGRLITLTRDSDTSWVQRLTTVGAVDSAYGTSGSAVMRFEAFDLAVHPSTGVVAVAGNGSSGGQVLLLDADGEPVATFGTGGTADVTTEDQLVRVEWLPSGELVVLDANLYRFPAALYSSVIRLGPDGGIRPFDMTTADLMRGASVAALLVSAAGMYFVGDKRLSSDTPAGADVEVTLLGMNHDGTPLAGFGRSGLAQAGSGGAAEVVWDMARLSDDALLVVGSAGVDPILARFESGALDTSYGTDGFASAYHTQVGRVAVDDADRIVAVTWVATVVRFLPDGTVDTAFGTDGHLQDLPGQARSVTLDGRQRIVVCGWEGTGDQYPLIARYLSDGTRDPSFGDAGVVLGYGDATAGTALDCHVDLEGKILLAGERFPPMAFPALYLARLNDDGTVDTTFGGAGVTALEGSAGANRILSRRGGGYLLANQYVFDESLQIMAIDASGQLDPGFGVGGIATFAAHPYPMLGFLELGDGRILVAAGVKDGIAEQLAVWCLQPDGRLDADFADGGVFLLPGWGRATALVPDGDGVLVGGFLFHPDSGTDVALLRLLP
ncbi:MAG: hypothetical protein HY907_16970 [Deltaproteobacteria bacterium]|nr:hypothetical protein [Deltaproteobacteria bacterium]